MSALMVLIMLATVALILPVNAEEELPKTLYVTKINQAVGTADGVIITKDFKKSDKVKSDPASGGNFVWAAVIAAEPTGNANEYRVTFSKKFIADKEEEVTIPANGFIYAAHCDDANKESDIYKKSSANQLATAALQVGAIIKVTDIDIAKSTLGANPSITIVSTSGTTSGSTSSTAASSAAASGTSSVASAASSTAASSTAASSVAASSAAASSTAASSTAAASSQANSTSSAATAESEAEGTSNTALYIGIAAAAIVIIAVVAVVLVKKNKKA